MTAGPTATGGLRSRWRRICGSMSRAEWGRAAGMAAFIIALHVIGWFTLMAIVAPEHYSLGTKGFGIGIGVSAYTLGMRHAFERSIDARDPAPRTRLTGAQPLAPSS
ncbi:hypothetical protein [Streptomyces mirabilis]|uniref:hypothetical protein n=1 Tax=Streptomyces mirabilis TaxID=68239 RepID=UPI00369EEAC2